MPRRFKSNTEFWLAVADAIEGGGYIQGSGSLQKKGAYCCLGVACDIDPDIKWGEARDSGVEARSDRPRDVSCVYPPRPHDGAYRGLGYHGLAVLANMNDDRCSFERIARYIRTVTIHELEEP